MQGRWWAAGLVVAVALGVATAADADEASQRAFSAGLVDLRAGRDESALQKFRDAVAADPEDAFARYYLGAALAKQGDTAAARTELEAALRLRPGFPEAAADLGILLIRSGEPEAALPLLAQAAEHPELRGRAHLMAGVARLRLDQWDRAIEDFHAAADADPRIAADARYYEGVAESRRGNGDLARERFQSVVRDRPDSAVGVEAQRFLDTGAVERPWVLYASIGFDYDSNVTLETDQQADRADQTLPDKGDGSVNFRLGGRYRLWGNETTAVTAGYEFFQRVYFDLDEYNLQGHRPGVRVTHRWGDVRFGVSLNYDYYLLESRSYLQRVTGLPWVAYQQGDWGRSELSYRVRWNGFFRRPPGGGAMIDPDGELADDVLDSVSHRPILRQYFYIDGPERFVSIAYIFEHRDPVDGGDPRFRYNSNGFEIGAGWLLPWQVSSLLSYTYLYEDYTEDNRVDQPHEIVLAFTRPILPGLTASVAYRGVINDSNQFEYERHIGSFLLQYVF